MKHYELQNRKLQALVDASKILHDKRVDLSGRGLSPVWSKLDNAVRYLEAQVREELAA